MTNILALDIGHTTGLFYGLVIAEQPLVRCINHAAITYPLDKWQQNQLRARLKRTDILLIEYPIINRMSTYQRKTRFIMNWWADFISNESDAGQQEVVQPSEWKPTKHLVPDDIIPQIDKNISQHERDAVSIAWWWLRWKYSKVT